MRWKRFQPWERPPWSGFEQKAKILLKAKVSDPWPEARRWA